MPLRLTDSFAKVVRRSGPQPRYQRALCLLGLVSSGALVMLGLSTPTLAQSRPSRPPLNRPTPSRPIPNRPSPSRPPAVNPSAAPAEIATLFQQIDTAASSQDANGVLQRYSPRFQNSDGLNRQTFEQALRSFWRTYPSLSYRTEITSWDRTPQGWTVETTTLITGTRTSGQRQLSLKGTLRSRQMLEGNTIVRQDILAERNEVTSGSKPPAIDFRLPEQVKTGQAFSFDVIVRDPIKEDILMGGILDEPIDNARFPDPTQVMIRPLLDPQTGTGPGGFFKTSEAPKTPENRWVSAVILRKGGLTMVTQRLRIVAAR